MVDNIRLDAQIGVHQQFIRLADRPGESVLDGQQAVARFPVVNGFEHINEGMTGQNVNAVAEVLPDRQLRVCPVNALKGNDVASRHSQLLKRVKGGFTA
jgi:hypothetical protein